MCRRRGLSMMPMDMAACTVCVCFLKITDSLTLLVPKRTASALDLLRRIQCRITGLYGVYTEPSAFCLLPSAFCLLASAFCLLPSAFWLLASGFWLLASGFSARNSGPNFIPCCTNDTGATRLLVFATSATAALGDTPSLSHHDVGGYWLFSRSAPAVSAFNMAESS